MTGTLNFKLLQDDSPYVLGALLTRLAARAGAEELGPLLRLLERERELAAELPKYKDTRTKTMQFFKGRTVSPTRTRTRTRTLTLTLTLNPTLTLTLTLILSRACSSWSPTTRACRSPSA